MSAQELIKQMHTKFGVNYEGPPRILSKEDVSFRINGMLEELFEYIEATYEVYENDIGWLAACHDSVMEGIKYLDLNPEPDLAEQFDALIDLSVFTLGTLERQGLPFDKGFKIVMEANLQKELARDLGQVGKRGSGYDLIKPEGWTPPDLDPLLDENHNMPSGIIVLDGPDGCGKTTLAAELVKKYGGVILHSTWSKELEERMDSYMLETFYSAKRLAEEGKLVILDRLWLSEMCYGEVYRGGSNWPDLHRCLDELLKSVNALHIICLPKDKNQFCEHFENLKEKRKEMYSKNMGDIYEAYYRLCVGIPLGKAETIGSQVNYSEYISNRGGLLTREDYARYDLFDQDPTNYDQVLEQLIQQLKEIQGE